MVAATAWLVSGALMNPSVLAKVMPALKVSSCGMAMGRIRLSRISWLIEGRHAVVPEPAGMDAFGYKGVAQGVHGQQRGHLDRVAEVIGKRAPGHGGAGGGFNTDDVDVLAVDLVPDKGKAQPGKIAAAAGAADDDIRVITGNGHLFLAFQADDGLVQHDMIQNTAQGVFGCPHPAPPLPRPR